MILREPPALSTTTLPVLVTWIHGTQVAFPAASVREITRAVSIAPLAGAPGVIEGAINLHGRIVPVVDVRQRLTFPAVAVTVSQYLVVLEAGDRMIVVRVDDVEDVIEVVASTMESPDALSPALQRLHGVAAIDGGALVIYDVDAFLTQAEHDALDLASAVPE